MNNERRTILEMVQAGQVTPDEAAELLAALEPGSEALDVPAPVPVPDSPAEPPVPYAPNMRRFRRYWEYPFGIGALIAWAGWMIISGASGLVALACGWPVMLLGGLTAVVGWLGRTSPWVHVRIQERRGRRIAISMPLPLDFLGWGLNLARRYVDRTTAENLDTASALLDTLKHAPADQPLSVEVDEEDGDHIEVYIG